VVISLRLLGAMNWVRTSHLMLIVFLLMILAVISTVGNFYSQLDLSNITTNTVTNICTLIFAVIPSGGDCA